MRAAAALGALLVLGHGALFVALASHPPAPFAVRVSAPPASERLAVTGEVAPELAARVRRLLDDAEDDGGADKPAARPGLHRVSWRADYRGGYTRSVGVTQLVGPFQAPGAPPCSGRVWLGQRLLDDGVAGPGTIAQLVQRLLERELAGQGRFPVGEFRGVSQLSVRWSELAAHPDDVAMLAEERRPPAASHGYLRVTASLAFTRVQVPLVLALQPYLDGDHLGVRFAVRANLAFDSSIAQWLSDRIGGERLASALVRRQLTEALRSTLAPPPPVALPGGGELRFVPCGEPPELIEGSHAALPFAVEVAARPGAPQLLPPLLRRGPALPPSPAAIALDLDLNALNALLYGAWRDGFLDRQLAAAGIDARFNADPVVVRYLSVRLGAPRLTLPPVLSPGGDGLRLAAEATVELRDGDRAQATRVWTAMQLSLAPAAGSARAGAPAPTAWRLGVRELDLTCELRPQLLTPCYAELVHAMRERAIEFDQALTHTLTQIVGGILLHRTLGAEDLPAELTLDAVQPTLRTQPDTATLRLEFEVALQPR